VRLGGQRRLRHGRRGALDTCALSGGSPSKQGPIASGRGRDRGHPQQRLQHTLCNPTPPHHGRRIAQHRRARLQQLRSTLQPYMWRVCASTSPATAAASASRSGWLPTSSSFLQRDVAERILRRRAQLLAAAHLRKQTVHLHARRRCVRGQGPNPTGFHTYMQQSCTGARVRTLLKGDGR